MVQGCHVGEKLFHVRVIDGLFPADGFGYVLDHLAGCVAQRRGAVEYGRHKGMVHVVEQQLRGFDLDVVVLSVVFAAAGEVILIFGGVLSLRGDGDVAFGAGVGDLDVIRQQVLREKPRGEYLLRILFVEDADGRAL